jgi:cell division protease FtsH
VDLVFNQFTTGAGNDLERATDLARKMVCNWGMSEELGPITFGRREEHIFLGREISQSKDFSEETARLIDHAMKNLVEGAYQQAKDLLATHRAVLQALAQGLLDRETLDSQEIDQIIESFKKKPEEPEPQEEVGPLPLEFQRA